MVKRLLLILALGAAFVACSPSGSSSSPGIDSSPLAPTPSLLTESAAPS